jgi:hypothetical protein
MTDTPPPDGTPHDPAVGYETRDVNLRAVLWFAGILAAVALAVHLALWGMFVLLREHGEPETRSHYPLSAIERGRLPQTEFGSPATGDLPHDPRLEGVNLASSGYKTGPDRGEIAAQARYAKDEEELNSYGPVQGKPGVVHIPIEQAMRLVVEESKQPGREPSGVRYDAGVAGTGGGSNSGRNLPEAKR